MDRDLVPFASPVRHQPVLSSSRNDFRFQCDRGPCTTHASRHALAAGVGYARMNVRTDGSSLDGLPDTGVWLSTGRPPMPSDSRSVAVGFGDVLRRLRLEAGLTQEALA